jgi:GTP-binding protein
LVDLPGYGFAKVSKDKKVKWEKMISSYLTSRKNLCGVFVLIDSRLEPQTIDLEFLSWCGDKEVPFVVAFTKADKQSKTQTDRNVKAFLDKLVEIFGDTPDYFVTSAEKAQGKDEVLGFLSELVSEYESQ